MVGWLFQEDILRLMVSLKLLQQGLGGGVVGEFGGAFSLNLLEGIHY
jgi:hypothetical protein